MPDIVDAREAALGGLLDNAAMLPPTQLGPADALRAHRRLADSDAQWILGRLLVPLSDLEELDAHLPDEGRQELSVILPRAGAGVFGTLGKELGRLLPFLSDERVRISALQGSIVGTHPAEEVDQVCTALVEAGVDDAIPLAIDVAFADRAPGEVLATVAAIAAAEGRPLIAHLPAGIEHAGTTELGGVLLACADARVRLSVGTGMGTVGRTMDGGQASHGVINVLAAAVLAHRGRRLTALRAALDAPSTDVRLGSGALILGDIIVETEWIEACRRDFLLAVACPDVLAAVAELATMGAVSPSGALAAGGAGA